MTNHSPSIVLSIMNFPATCCGTPPAGGGGRRWEGTVYRLVIGIGLQVLFIQCWLLYYSVRKNIYIFTGIPIRNLDSTFLQIIKLCLQKHVLKKILAIFFELGIWVILVTPSSGGSAGEGPFYKNSASTRRKISNSAPAVIRATGKVFI